MVQYLHLVQVCYPELLEAELALDDQRERLELNVFSIKDITQ